MCVLLTADILQFIAIFYFLIRENGKAEDERGVGKKEKVRKLIAAEICQNLPKIMPCCPTFAWEDTF